ncbi:MAG: hypothetical protein RL685_7143 [Pseudomonadota bacterium]
MLRSLALSARLEPAIGAKLVALGAAGCELAAHVTALLVDAAGVRLAHGAVMHARAMFAHAKRHLAEVPFVELLEDVVALCALPAHQICVRDQDGARPLEAAGPALETVQVAHVGGRVAQRGRNANSS